MPVLADVQNQMLLMQYGRDRYGLRRFLVQSQTEPNKFYKIRERMVDEEFYCDCKAFEHRPSAQCKHILAVKRHLNVN